MYNLYKESLKLLKNNDYEKAEENLIELLNNKLLNDDLNEEEEDSSSSSNDKMKQQLKYVILKNLSTINLDYKNDIESSLNYLIKVQILNLKSN